MSATLRAVAMILAFLLCSCIWTVAAHAQGPFTGTWTVVDAQTAPWVDKSAANQPQFDPAIRHATIVFRKSSVDGPQPIGCRKVQYTVTMVEPEELFQGGLTDPVAQAAALGFPDSHIDSLNVGCLRSDADLEMDFAMTDHDTILFALNNVIYRMKRMRTSRPSKEKQRCR